jgi:hypothetical protein
MKNMINLLPESIRRQQLARKRVLEWCLAMCVVIVGNWASHWYERREQHALAHELDVLAREHQPTQVMLKHLVEMRQRLSDLQNQEVVARELEYQRNPLALLGVISQTTQNSKGRLRVLKLELTDFQRTNHELQAQTSASAADAPTTDVRLSGVSLDNPAVAELVDGLENSGLFRQVDLTMKERESGTIALRDYEVSASIK